MLDSVIKICNNLPDSALTVYLDRFVRQFQLPNTKKPIALIKLNEQKVKERMVLSNGVHEYYRPVSNKLATKLR